MAPVSVQGSMEEGLRVFGAAGAFAGYERFVRLRRHPDKARPTVSAGGHPGGLLARRLFARGACGAQATKFEKATAAFASI